MIVLGITPGIRNVGYCVLSYEEGRLPRVPKFGADLLKGIRMNGATSLVDLQKKATAHLKVLEIIFERFPPIVVAVGPQAKADEPEHYVAASRLALRLATFALTEGGLRVQHEEWRTKAELMAALGATRWPGILDGRIENREKRLKLKKPGVELAAATALAACTRVRLGTHK